MIILYLKNTNDNLVFVLKLYHMFGLFKKESEVEKLKKQYTKLLEESFQLSKSDRKKSDEKAVEAQAVLEQIEILQKK